MDGERSESTNRRTGGKDAAPGEAGKLPAVRVEGSPSLFRHHERTEGEEIVHTLRNVLFALQYGVSGLQESKEDSATFNMLHAAVTEKLRSMKDLIGRVGTLLEADRVRTKAESRIRVLCVDDSPDITSVMQMVIDAEPMMECVGCLSSADELVPEARRLRLPPAPVPALLVLLDATMPGKSPLKVMAEMAVEFPDVKTIVYSAHDDEVFVDNVMGAGAWGCVSKNEGPEAILRVLREVAAGGVSWPKM